MAQKVIIAVLAVVVVLLAVPLAAGVLKKGEASTAPSETPGPPPPGPPQVVSMDPTNGATGVSPSLDKLVVVFDRPMGGGFSWTGGGEQMPEGAGSPYWSADKKTCTLPVRLKPNWSYRLGLNSPSHRNFRSEEGLPLERVVWTFSTGQ
jgi:hypothetical protein